jgi:hypothetical protein
VLRKHFRLADLGNNGRAWEAKELSEFAQGLRPETGGEEDGDLSALKSTGGVKCARCAEFSGKPPGYTSGLIGGMITRRLTSMRSTFDVESKIQADVSLASRDRRQSWRMIWDPWGRSKQGRINALITSRPADP